VIGGDLTRQVTQDSLPSWSLGDDVSQYRLVLLLIPEDPPWRDEEGGHDPVHVEVVNHRREGALTGEVGSFVET